MGLLNASMFGALPALMQQKKPGEGITPKPDPSFGSQLVRGLSNPMFSNGVQMMATGEPPPVGMGPVTNTEFMNAFSGNPQFQQQLQAIQQGQGPGRQPPQFTPPQMPMSTTPPPGGRGMGGGLGSLGGNPLNNYGMSMGDPVAMQALRMMRGTAF